jgi:hypothetical protein
VGHALPLACALMTKQAGSLYPGHVGELDLGGVAAQPYRAALAPVAGAFDLNNFFTDFPC